MFCILQPSGGLRLNIPSPSNLPDGSSPPNTTLASAFASFSSAIPCSHAASSSGSGLASAHSPSSYSSQAQSPYSPHTPLPGTPLSYPGFGAFGLHGGANGHGLTPGGREFGTGFNSGPSSAGTGQSPWAGNGFGFGFTSAGVPGAMSPGAAYGAGNGYGLGAMTPLPAPERRGSASSGFDFGFGSSIGANKNKALSMTLGRARSKSGGSTYFTGSGGSGSTSSASTPGALFDLDHNKAAGGFASDAMSGQGNDALETPTAGLFGSIATMTIGGNTAVNQNGKRLRDLEEDGQKDKEWVAEEEEILSSFLMNPLRPLTVPYPPSTLPPPRALDELTSQILHFHTPEEPSIKPSSANASSRTASSNAHRRTRSTTGLVWKHTWLSTRKKLFDVARKESMGLEKEDRWKGRVVERVRSDSVEIPFPMTPLESSMPIPSLEDVAEIEAMPPAITRKGGHRRELSASSRMLASLGFGSMAAEAKSSFGADHASSVDGLGLRVTMPKAIEEQDETEEDAMASGATTSLFGQGFGTAAGVAPPKKGLGQVLRASTSLQRSSKANGSVSSALMTGIPVPPRAPVTHVRPSSLLQRGKSFTATDFEKLSLDGPDKADDSMEVEVELESSSLGFNETLGFTTPRKPSAGSDVFSSASPSFGSSLLDSPSPNGSAYTDMGDDSLDEDDNLATPHSKASPPFIMLTHSSPSPSKDRSAVPFGRDAPGSPSPASKTLGFMANTPGSLRRPKPPPLMRSLSTNSGNIGTQPSAFSRFMGTGAKDARPEAAFAAWRSTSESHLTTTSAGFELPTVSPTTEAFNKRETLLGPSAKKQKGPTGLSVILPLRNGLGLGSDLENGGLRSPFVEDGQKQLA